MKGKDILFGDEAIDRVKKGVDKLADTVKVTLGPKGKCVAISNPFSSVPLVTKDGVTVAREVVLKDQFENAGAQLVKEVAQKTADIAGDGTTTATLLAQAMFTEGLRAVKAGANPTFVKKGIEDATQAAIESIKVLSIPVDKEKLRAVASISANNDNVLGDLIAGAMDDAGMDGVITVEDSKTFSTYTENITGMEIPRGYISPYFINNDKLTCELLNCGILITDKRISNHGTIMPLMEKCAKSALPLLIISGDMDGTALSVLIFNAMKGTVKGCAVKAPGFGDNQLEMLEDIAASTGGRVINSSIGLNIEDVTLGDLGQAEKVIITKDNCTIIGGRGKEDDIKKRIDMTKVKMESSQSDFDREKAQERLAKLTGGVIVLYIGAATETEMKEKKARVEDALHATRAAVEEGIVPGGGVAYIHASRELSKLEIPESNNQEDIKAGVNIVAKALHAPLYQICANAGINGEVIYSRIQDVVERTSNANIGYNIINDKIDDMIAQGVIDPTKVAVNALRNASSVVSLLLTLEAVIVDEPENENQNAPVLPAYPNPIMR